MQLDKRQQAILDGKEGEIKAKVMKTLVMYGETFGAEKAGYLYSQYHFYDIYQNSRYADFVLENRTH